ncbi:hypothetical protein C8Q70DRAFT_273315 [Cubamyces menziesii]|nr:hypothetical protein C8Q70DRAFT_273315 [Cubamyces menziesii]
MATLASASGPLLPFDVDIDIPATTRTSWALAGAVAAPAATATLQRTAVGRALCARKRDCERIWRRGRTRLGREERMGGEKAISATRGQRPSRSADVRAGESRSTLSHSCDPAPSFHAHAPPCPSFSRSRSHGKAIPSCIGTPTGRRSRCGNLPSCAPEGDDSRERLRRRAGPMVLMSFAALKRETRFDSRRAIALALAYYASCESRVTDRWTTAMSPAGGWESVPLRRSSAAGGR